jgi:antitoxin component HigA of HigAB toxin-antitoxin module/mRNA-degrading endonuclease HigB of HigAB toxin-antitoxin module
VFNIVARKTLLGYCRQFPDAARSLQQWYYEFLKSEFKNFNELKEVYPNQSLVKDDRVVFNILGNKYRLVVRVIFDFKAVQIKWFGTHAVYDQINVEKIDYKKGNEIMILKIIKSNKEYEAMLDWVDQMFDRKVKHTSPEGEQVQVALLLLKEYEDKYHAIPIPDPLEAIKLKMAEKRLKSKDLIGLVGSKGYISSILSGKKPLTLDIARKFYKKLGVPAEILLS